MNNFSITESSLYFYVAGDAGRAAHMNTEEVYYDASRYDRGVSMAPKTPGINRGVISHSPFTITGELYDVLDSFANEGFRVNGRMVKAVQAIMNAFNAPSARVDPITALSRYAGEVIFTDTFYDWRGRVYTLSSDHGGLQVSKAARACMEAPEGVPVGSCPEALDFMLKTFEHEGWCSELCDVAAKRWRQDHVAAANNDINKIDFMGIRASMAIEEIVLTGSTAYLIEQDATCSGFQHMALVGGDKELAREVNATITDTRGDLYMWVANEGQVARLLGITDRQARSLVKPVVMLTGYGSGINAIVLSYFNDERAAQGLPAFADKEECKESEFTITFHGLGEVDFDKLKGFVKPLQLALMRRFPCIRELQNSAKDHFRQCVATSDEGDTRFVWTTSDGFEACRFILDSELENEEVGENGALPNIIHSLDGQIIREVRRTWDSGVLGVVHDAFFSTVIDALKLRECVQRAYATVHASYPADFPLSRSEACMVVGMCIGA